MELRLEQLLADLAKPLSLKLVAGAEGLKRAIRVTDLNRPGLALSGFLDYFPTERLQVLGKTEMTFWNTLKPEVRRERLERFVFKLKPAGLILSHDVSIPKEIAAACERAGVALLATPLPTTKFISELTTYLEERLAPAVSMHGSLMDVFGVGVLIMGESGIGKSECALALLDKGHRLCADDVVEIRRTPEKTLDGTGVKELRYHMEIRGLGIVEVQSLFGARAVRERKLVELVILLVPWKSGQKYDRTGLEEKTYTIMDVPLTMHEFPVKPGRNLAVLVETAAMNWRLKQMGVHSADRLNERILMNLKSQERRTVTRRSRGVPQPLVRRRRGER